MFSSVKYHKLILIQILVEDLVETVGIEDLVEVAEITVKVEIMVEEQDVVVVEEKVEEDQRWQKLICNASHQI